VCDVIAVPDKTLEMSKDECSLSISSALACIKALCKNPTCHVHSALVVVTPPWSQAQRVCMLRVVHRHRQTCTHARTRTLLPQAVKSVLQGHVQSALAVVRPPGHHAECARAQGFCFYNNCAVAARVALACEGVRRVLVLDWDVHHGNGIQEVCLCICCAGRGVEVKDRTAIRVGCASWEWHSGGVFVPLLC
jgi:hypothetical protein